MVDGRLELPGVALRGGGLKMGILALGLKLVALIFLVAG